MLCTKQHGLSRQHPLIHTQILAKVTWEALVKVQVTREPVQLAKVHKGK